jgi:hypothetical protein
VELQSVDRFGEFPCAPGAAAQLLVDRLNYQGLRHAQGDTPDRRQTVTTRQMTLINHD